VRDDARRKDQSGFLRRGIHRRQQAPACDSSASRPRIDNDLPHSREVNHEAVIAGAKTSQAVPSASNGGQNSNLRGGSDCVLHIAYIRAARDQSWRASYHAIPNGARGFVAALARAKQIAFESPEERRVNLVAGFEHFAVSLQNVRNSERPTDAEFCLLRRAHSADVILRLYPLPPFPAKILGLKELAVR
jgi:hypothetical protein